MGKKDLWQSDYFDKNDRFADIFNGILFGDNRVILPDELSETDGEIISTSETGSCALKWTKTAFAQFKELQEQI